MGKNILMPTPSTKRWSALLGATLTWQDRTHRGFRVLGFLGLEERAPSLGSCEARANETGGTHAAARGRCDRLLDSTKKTPGVPRQPLCSRQRRAAAERSCTGKAMTENFTGAKEGPGRFARPCDQRDRSQHVVVRASQDLRRMSAFKNGN
jgi:hypothetical protein